MLPSVPSSASSAAGPSRSRPDRSYVHVTVTTTFSGGCGGGGGGWAGGDDATTGEVTSGDCGG
eukprot:4512617-Prymnesium_polylepis.1